MDLVRIGILGAVGTRAQDFFKLFSRRESNVVVVAVADTNTGALHESFKARPNIRLYATAEELFADPDIDAVIITTPDFLHEEHACAALNAGLHVYVEKPLAHTLDGCHNIMEAARRNNRTLYVGHNLRHFTVFKKMKELVDAGAVGEVKAISCRRSVSYSRWAYFKEGRWQNKRKNTDSLLIHKGSHDLDIIHWLGGAYARRVTAMGKLAVWNDQPGEPDVEDISLVHIELTNGVLATYMQCHFAFRAACEYEIFGTKGTLRNLGDQPGDAVIQLFGKRGKSLLGEVTEEWRFEKETGYHGDADMRITEEFVGILRGTVTPTISTEDAMEAVMTGLSATQSLRQGNVPIDIP